MSLIARFLLCFVLVYGLLQPVLCTAQTDIANLVTDNQVEICGMLRHEIPKKVADFVEDKENDSTYTTWLIDLPKPINVIAGRELEKKPFLVKVSEIQITSIFPGDRNFEKRLDKKLKMLNQKQVIASGELGTNLGAQATPVVLWVEKIKEAGSQKACTVKQGSK